MSPTDTIRDGKNKVMHSPVHHFQLQHGGVWDADEVPISFKLKTW